MAKAKKKAATKKKAAGKKKAAAKKAAAKKAPARKEETSAVAVRNNDSDLAEIDPLLAETMDSGNEEVGADDMSTPFLAILQGLSPAVVKGSDVYDEDAEAGDFIHTVSRELFSGEEGLVVVPAYYMKRWIEWVPRSKGGGFIRQYEQGEAPPFAVKGDITLWMNEDGTQYIGDDPKKNADRQATLTHMHFLILCTDAGPEPVMFSCTSTQLTPSSKWNALTNAQRIKGRRLARFSTLYRLTTTMRQNAEGSWYVFGAGVERRLEPSTNGEDLELFNIARDFKTAAVEDRLKVDHKQDDDAPRQSNEPTPPAQDAFDGDLTSEGDPDGPF